MTVTRSPNDETVKSAPMVTVAIGRLDELLSKEGGLIVPFVSVTKCTGRPFLAELAQRHDLPLALCGGLE